MSDITALLNDLSYIPLNNEHNEPTQGDIGDTSNEPTLATRNEFEELYASTNEELYPSCDYVTRLDFMAKFTYFKVKGKLTDSIFNEMLEFFQNVFPISKGYKLPSSYYAIRKTFKMIGLGYESIHACKHDCCLFRGDDNKDLDFCPVCNMSRWKDSNTSGKKGPKMRCEHMLPSPTTVTTEGRIPPPHHVPSGCMGCFDNREEMRRLEAMGIYNDDEINRLAREGSSEDTLPVWIGSGGCGDEEEGADHQDDEDEDGDGDT
nr:hypothetical protein [Tanacetum cinerariifolium]